MKKSQRRKQLTQAEVRTLRLALGYSVAQLAEAVGVTRGTVYKWEAGIHRPSRLAMTCLGWVGRHDRQVGLPLPEVLSVYAQPCAY